jgi:hypothetical protein
MFLRTIFEQRLADAERALAQLPPLPESGLRDDRGDVDELRRVVSLRREESRASAEAASRIMRKVERSFRNGSTVIPIEVAQSNARETVPAAKGISCAQRAVPHGKIVARQDLRMEKSWSLLARS